MQYKATSLHVLACRHSRSCNIYQHFWVDPQWLAYRMSATKKVQMLQ